MLLSHLRLRLHFQYLLVTWISLRLGHISFPYHHHELYYIYIGGTSITTLLILQRNQRYSIHVVLQSPYKHKRKILIYVCVYLYRTPQVLVCMMLSRVLVR